MQINFIVADRRLIAIVTLSQRNLLALLDKLLWGASARTITRSCENGMQLVVRAESDEDHYRLREAGPMHKRTEAAIKQFAPEKPERPTSNNGEKHR